MKVFPRIYSLIFVLIMLLIVPLSASDRYKKYKPTDANVKFMSISASKGEITFTSYYDGKFTAVQFEREEVELTDDEVRINGERLFSRDGFQLPDSFYNTDIVYSVDIDTNQGNQSEVVFYKKSGAKAEFYRAKSRNLISIIEDITIKPAQFVRGSVVSFWADINIPDGEILENVVAIAGNINIGAKAVIRGDVIALDGEITLDKSATIYGMIQATNLNKNREKHKWYRWYRTGKYFSLITRFKYNRVDGAAPHLGVGFIDEDSLLPEIKVYGGYAFASERWRYHFGLAQSFKVGLPLTVGSRIYRKLASHDDAIISETENSIFALLATEDYKDYYEAEGLYIFAIFRPIRFTSFESGFITEKHHWLYARRDLWSMFGGSKLFPENFSSIKPEIRDNEIDRVNDKRMKSLVTSITLNTLTNSLLRTNSYFKSRFLMEWAPSEWNDNYDFTRYFIEVTRHQYISKYLAFRIRGLIGSSGGDLPIHRFFYLGGVGTLLGYDHKEYYGSSIWLASLETRFKIPRSEFGIRLFFNTGQTATKAGEYSQAEIKSSLGFGIAIYDHIRLYVARRMDRSENNWLFHVRLGRDF